MMAVQTSHKFPGALGALRWLRENGFMMGVNYSDTWRAEDGKTAVVVDQPRRTTVVVTSADAGTHEPAVCKPKGPGYYSFRNWSFDYVCPTCGAKKRFNRNFLGQTDLVCVGVGKFQKVRR